MPKKPSNGLTAHTPSVRGGAQGKLRALTLLLVLALLAASGCSSSQPKPVGSLTPDQIRAEIIPQEGTPTSYGIPLSIENTQQFIGFHDSITLTAEQEKVKQDALTALRAPCCDDNTMYDC
jgi:hypothetical protein